MGVPASVPLDRAYNPDTYREHHEELKKRLDNDGFLGLLLIDVSEINEVERAYGSSKYEDLMAMVRKVVAEFKGDQLRENDIVTLNEKAGDVFLIFLAPRKESPHLLAEDIEKIGERVDSELSRRIRQTAFAILRKRPEVFVGTSLVLQNPLIRGERLVTRAIEEAHHAARLNVQRRHLRNKQNLSASFSKNRSRPCSNRFGTWRNASRTVSRLCAAARPGPSSGARRRCST